jgi:hypothetical protein
MSDTADRLAQAVRELINERSRKRSSAIFEHRRRCETLHVPGLDVTVDLGDLP